MKTSIHKIEINSNEINSKNIINSEKKVSTEIDNSISVKTSENCCKKFLRLCIGGIVGATSAILMPAAQWLLNIRDKIHEEKPINRYRWPALLDIGASAVVAYGAIVRFGNPALWCIAAAEGCLAFYGFFRGIQISKKSEIIEIPKQLWNSEISSNITKDSTNNSIPNAVTTLVTKSCSKRIAYLVGGSMFGICASLLMPSVQSMHYIMSAKRRWPPIINGGILTYYALYVGSIYIGPEVSILLLKRSAQILSAYGVMRGGYIAYHENPSKVFTLMWQGGFSLPRTPKNSVYLPSIEFHPTSECKERASDVSNPLC